MSGFVDLHSHLLPGADDGVATEADALECLRAAQGAGFTDIVLSRHQMAGVYTLGAQAARAGREALQRAADEAGIAIRLHDGAEHYADDVFLGAVATGPEAIAGGRTLLVEVPMMGLPPFMADLAFRIRVKGYSPLLAHVERYRDVIDKPRRGRDLADMGYLLQVNLGSLAGVYGRQVERAARELLGDGVVFCVAGDVHGPKWVAPSWVRGIKELRSYGDAAVRTWLADNPGRVLRGDSI